MYKCGTVLFQSQFIFNTMLQEEDETGKNKIEVLDEIHTGHNSRPDKALKESQLDFEKNYPKNIFIPMIEYLAEIGLRRQYEEQVGSREEFEGKNVVSLSLIHKLMGAEWFRDNVQTRILISNICNKILMNSKIKKKLFHVYIVRSLFDVFDEDLKQFKKRISKLANSISEESYDDDELFEFPSSILYLLRLFYKFISHDINQQINPRQDSHHQTPSKHHSQPISHSPEQKPLETPPFLDLQQNPLERTPSCASELQPLSCDTHQTPKQGSKEQYKFYIRKIIHQFNTELMNKDFYDKMVQVESGIIQREKQIVEKYKLPDDVPAWNVFIDQVVYKCFECYKKSGKITHAMMNTWIGNFKDIVTTAKGLINLGSRQEQKRRTKKQMPYSFKPLILQYFPNQK